MKISQHYCSSVTATALTCFQLVSYITGVSGRISSRSVETTPPIWDKDPFYKSILDQSPPEEQFSPLLQDDPFTNYDDQFLKVYPEYASAVNSTSTNPGTVPVNSVGGGVVPNTSQGTVVDAPSVFGNSTTSDVPSSSLIDTIMPNNISIPSNQSNVTNKTKSFTTLLPTTLSNNTASSTKSTFDNTATTAPGRIRKKRRFSNATTASTPDKSNAIAYTNTTSDNSNVTVNTASGLNNTSGNSSDTNATNATVSGLPPLFYAGNNWYPASAFPLLECQGDCDGDEECDWGLICFQRDGFAPVPGCDGTGGKNSDYCIKPGPNTYVLYANSGYPIEYYPLDACQGSCTNSSDCATGLVCVVSPTNTTSAFCTGNPVEGFGYCVEPSDTHAV